MKILVIGGSGLIGSHLMTAAAAAGHGVIGTYRNVHLPGLVRLDCSEARTVEALLDVEAPNAVIHAAGWTWVDGCEDDPKRAFAENSEQPATIAALCKKRGIHFSFFSSSYVFDGIEGPYSEDAKPNPINVYGRSKLEGEQRIAEASGGEALVARVICVYGAEAQKKNFAYQVLRAMREGKELLLPSDQCGNPTHAGDIARWAVALAEKREGGVWHLGGPWPECARPEWAEKLVKAFRQNGVTPHKNFSIKTIATSELKQKALRPLKAGIISNKTNGKFYEPTPLEGTVREIF